MQLACERRIGCGPEKWRWFFSTCWIFKNTTVNMVTVAVLEIIENSTIK